MSTRSLLILLAPDSLKGALSATQACAAMQRGAQRAAGNLSLQFVSVPLADGGEGTVEAFLTAVGGEAQTVAVRGPSGALVEAQWAKLPDGTAVIEMAQASGLTLVAPHERDAPSASSYGTGELIRAALDAGCRKLLIGVGGSATTDGGSGALSALGARFLDEHGAEIPPGGAALQNLGQIDLKFFDKRVLNCEMQVLCDVTNPLCGERGAARVYGPQKGASAQQVEILDSALAHFANTLGAHQGRDLRDTPGAGAAGGIAFGLMSLCNARLVPGIEAVLQVARFSAHLEDADLVLTAEGAIDSQTPQGKALAGVARAAQNAKRGTGVPVIAFGGAVKLSGEELARMGIVAAIPLPNAPLPLEECIARADELLDAATERALRLWLSGRGYNT